MKTNEEDLRDIQEAQQRERAARMDRNDWRKGFFAGMACSAVMLGLLAAAIVFGIVLPSAQRAQAIADKQLTDARGERDVLMQKFATATVIYEPVSAQMAHGLLQVQPGAAIAAAAPEAPKWYVQSQVVPRLLKGEVGMYLWVRPNGKMEGPFVAPDGTADQQARMPLP
jgi:hypothetical protein